MSPDGLLRVVLTENQRARVKELTGREMDVLELEDTVGVEAERMPIAQPEEIELMAVREARRLNDEEEAERRWLLDLAARQDAEEARTREMEALRKEAEAETRREQKRMEAEFKLIAAGKKTPRQKQAAAQKKARKKASRKKKGGGGA